MKPEDMEVGGWYQVEWDWSWWAAEYLGVNQHKEHEFMVRQGPRKQGPLIHVPEHDFGDWTVRLLPIATVTYDVAVREDGTVEVLGVADATEGQGGER